MVQLLYRDVVFHRRGEESSELLLNGQRGGMALMAIAGHKAHQQGLAGNGDGRLAALGEFHAVDALGQKGARRRRIAQKALDAGGGVDQGVKGPAAGFRIR